jgi:hypothetical protein
LKGLLVSFEKLSRARKEICRATRKRAAEVAAIEREEKGAFISHLLLFGTEKRVRSVGALVKEYPSEAVV